MVKFTLLTLMKQRLHLCAATNYKNYKDVSADPVALCCHALKTIVRLKSYSR